MATNKKRFTFDDEDTIEISKEELHSSIKEIEDTNVSVKLNKPVNDVEDKVKEKKTKKKLKIKKRYIVLLVVVLLIGGFFIYVFKSTENKGPVYGDRCKALMSVDTDSFSDIESQIVSSDERFVSLNIQLDCRIIKFTINFVDNISTEEAMELSYYVLHYFDDSIGYEKEEGASYSALFGYANGRGQYNGEFHLKSNGNEAFPIFGTKHPSIEEISFTVATPKDQATTDDLTRQNENDAEGNE